MRKREQREREGSYSSEASAVSFFLFLFFCLCGDFVQPALDKALTKSIPRPSDLHQKSCPQFRFKKPFTFDLLVLNILHESQCQWDVHS